MVQGKKKTLKRNLILKGETTKRGGGTCRQIALVLWYYMEDSLDSGSSQSINQSIERSDQL
jgi:hypothetical protein